MVADLRACLLQLGEPVRPVPLVEGRRTVHDLQGEPQGRGQWAGAQGEPFGRKALGLRCLGAQQRRVGGPSKLPRTDQVEAANRVGRPRRAPRYSGPAWLVHLAEAQAMTPSSTWHCMV